MQNIIKLYLKLFFIGIKSAIHIFLIAFTLNSIAKNDIPDLHHIGLNPRLDYQEFYIKLSVYANDDSSLCFSDSNCTRQDNIHAEIESNLPIKRLKDISPTKAWIKRCNDNYELVEMLNMETYFDTNKNKSITKFNMKTKTGPVLKQGDIYKLVVLLDFTAGLYGEQKIMGITEYLSVLTEVSEVM